MNSKASPDQIEQLNRRIAAIQESIHKDGSRQARLEEIQNIIAERNANETQYDDSIVRQMIECIKVHNDGKGEKGLGSLSEKTDKYFSQSELLTDYPV